MCEKMIVEMGRDGDRLKGKKQIDKWEGVIFSDVFQAAIFSQKLLQRQFA